MKEPTFEAQFRCTLKANTVFNFVHDEDNIEIGPNEPKMIIGVHCFEQNRSNVVKNDHF